MTSSIETAVRRRAQEAINLLEELEQLEPGLAASGHHQDIIARIRRRPYLAGAGYIQILQGSVKRARQATASAAVTMRIRGDALGQATPQDGEWVKAYSPHGNGGRGDLETTTDPAQAKTWPDSKAALEAWQEVSRTHPRRADAKPNRPLTALNVEIARPHQPQEETHAQD